MSDDSSKHLAPVCLGFLRGLEAALAKVAVERFEVCKLQTDSVAIRRMRDSNRWCLEGLINSAGVFNGNIRVPWRSRSEVTLVQCFK